MSQAEERGVRKVHRCEYVKKNLRNKHTSVCNFGTFIYTVRFVIENTWNVFIVCKVC